MVTKEVTKFFVKFPQHFFIMVGDFIFTIQDYLQDSSKTNFDLDKLLCEKTEPLLQGAYTKYNCKISSNLTFGEIVTDRSVQQKSTSVELMGPPVVKQCRWFSTRDDECRNQHFTYNLLHVQVCFRSCILIDVIIFTFLDF